MLIVFPVNVIVILFGLFKVAFRGE